MKKYQSHEKNLVVWSHFIKAERKLLDRFSAPIGVIPNKTFVNSKGRIKVEIDQYIYDDEILKAIKSFFRNIKDEDIFLEKGYFLLDNDSIPSQLKLNEFASTVEKYYYNFNPYPTIEGILTKPQSPFKKLIKQLENHNIDFEINQVGEMLLSHNGIMLFDKQRNIARKKQIGAIYSVKIAKNKLIEKSIKTLFQDLQISNNKFFISAYQNRIYAFDAIITSNMFHHLAKLIGLKMVNCSIKIWVNQKKFIGKWKKSSLKKHIKESEEGKYYYEFYASNNQVNFEGKAITIHEYFLLCYHSILLSYGKKGIEGLEKQHIFEYNSRSSYFKKINALELNEEVWSKIKESLNNIDFWCNTLKNTISFDFTSKNDFIVKYNQLKAIEWLEMVDFGEEHKFKITPIVPKQFEQAKLELQRKFKHIQFREDNSGQNLLIRYSYKTSDDERIAKLKFLNEINKIKKKGFNFKVDKQFRVKFILEENTKLKEFEENNKFDKIRGCEIREYNKVIGTLRRANYPILELQLNDEYINTLEKDSSSKKVVSLEAIWPVLKGDIEKIYRLENAIEKLETDGKELPNPNIVNFIFDSSKAKAVENVSIYEEISEEWQEIMKTKLSSNINKSQVRAVLATLHSKDLAIIQGPPGTGKSTAISEIIWQHIRTNPKQKILLTSETHLAVDNAMGKLATPHNNLVKIIRFGKYENLEEEGARFSLIRMNNWVNDIQEDIHVADNGITQWMDNIAQKSTLFKADQSLNSCLKAWQKILKHPKADIRKLFKDAYVKHINVIGATCSSISERTSYNKPSFFIKSYNDIFPDKKNNIYKAKINFDVVIMDEASKATPPEFALPLLFGKKSIVVGDHRQLPPMLDENDFATTLEIIGERKLAQVFKRQDHNISHFEKLFLNPEISSTIKASFDTQYRMHPQINDVIKQFYVDDRGLNCGLDMKYVDDSNLNNPISRYHGFSHENFITPATHVIWVDVDTPEILEGTSRVNFGEVEACAKVLHYLKNSKGFDQFQNHWTKLEDKEIGLISFYGRQLHYLSQVAKQFKNQIPIRVRTVDRFQGMERNIIIVSLVRSNRIASSKEQEPNFEIYPELGYSYQNALGFAEFPNRLNVALSRAKRLLIIVGNSKHFSKMEMYKNVYHTIQNSKYDRVIDIKTLDKYNVNLIP